MARRRAVWGALGGAGQSGLLRGVERLEGGLVDDGGAHDEARVLLRHEAQARVPLERDRGERPSRAQR
jgi:hypothetical protein